MSAKTKLVVRKLRVGIRGRVYQATVLDMSKPIGERAVFFAIQLGWNKSTRGQCESYIKAVTR